MMTQAKRLLALALALVLLGGPVQGAHAAVTAGAGQPDGTSTPPRLSFSDGEVSFWRPGADDWAPAQINTPIAPGDERVDVVVATASGDRAAGAWRPGASGRRWSSNW